MRSTTTRRRGYGTSARPPRRGPGRLLLFFVLLGCASAAMVWRTSPSPTPVPRALIPTGTPTAALTTAPVGAPTAAPVIAVPHDPTRQPSDGLSAVLGPAIDTLIAQYEPQGVSRVGLVIDDGRPTDLVQRNADDRFAAASLYKLFVLWRTQEEIRTGRVRDDTELMLTAANDDSDEDGYSLGDYGDTITVADARRLMITVSNNTAAWVLADYFGWGTIDQLVRANGFTATVIAGQAHTTAREVTRFYAGILNRNLDPMLQSDDYDLMLALLKAQEINTKLSTGFPADAVFAHKTGDLAGIHNDAGVLFLPDGRKLYVTVLTAGDYDASVAFQHDLAALIWRTFGVGDRRP